MASLNHTTSRKSGWDNTLWTTGMSHAQADSKNPCLPTANCGFRLTSSLDAVDHSHHIYTLQHSTQHHLGALPGSGTQTKSLREGSSFARAEMVLTHMDRASLVPITALGSWEALINVCTENSLLGPNDTTSLTEPDTNLQFRMQCNLHSLKS